MQLVTNGVKVTEYRPADNDKAVDIIVRFPRTAAASTRSTNCACRRLPVKSRSEISSPACAAPRVGYINRVNANRVMTVSANIADGVQNAVVQKEVIDRASTRPILATA